MLICISVPHFKQKDYGHYKEESHLHRHGRYAHRYRFRKTFPEGVWDMKLKMEVFAQLKKLHPQAVLIVSNQGGIELGHVHPAMFQPKFIYVIACLQSYIGLNTLVAGQFCPYNDKKHPKRKPNPGMLEDMLAEFTHNTGITISKEDCLMIGDASGLEGQFSDSDLKTAENFGCDYLDVTEFTNMELPEPLFKVIRLSDGEVVKDKDGIPLQKPYREQSHS